MKTVTVEVYRFDELSPTAQGKVVASVVDMLLRTGMLHNDVAKSDDRILTAARWNYYWKDGRFFASVDSVEGNFPFLENA